MLIEGEKIENKIKTYCTLFDLCKSALEANIITNGYFTANENG